MTPGRSIPERKRVVSEVTHPRNGHELLEIEERLPGPVPTDVGRELANGRTYRTRYWRCRHCGQERNTRAEFGDSCEASAPVTPRADGGYSVHDARTRDALTDHLTVSHVGPGDIYAVASEYGPTHRVDLLEETCTCRDNQLANELCTHLRRVDIEVRIGTVRTSDD